jgi:hypothetical protein
VLIEQQAEEGRLDDDRVNALARDRLSLTVDARVIQTPLSIFFFMENHY